MADPPNADADAEANGTQRFERWLSLGGSIVAPATLLSALLFYFGYVSSRAQYDYFGVDVDTIGLSTQDYVMRSPGPLLVPLLVLTLAGAGFGYLHARARRRAATHPSLRFAARRMIVVGVAGLGAGVVLLFAYAAIGRWAYYPLVTPLVLAVAGALTAYGLATRRRLDAATSRVLPGPGVVALLWLAVAASLFWATATVAQWSGLGQAQEQARELRRLPSVIVDSPQRLFLPAAAGVRERDLTGSANTPGFRYRYVGLRLLIQGGDRMFLVPSVWSPSATTLVLPLDGNVRVQFQFRNRPP